MLFLRMLFLRMLLYLRMSFPHPLLPDCVYPFTALLSHSSPCVWFLSPHPSPLQVACLFRRTCCCFPHTVRAVYPNKYILIPFLPVCISLHPLACWFPTCILPLCIVVSLLHECIFSCTLVSSLHGCASPGCLFCLHLFTCVCYPSPFCNNLHVALLLLPYYFFPISTLRVFAPFILLFVFPLHDVFLRACFPPCKFFSLVCRFISACIFQKMCSCCCMIPWHFLLHLHVFPLAHSFSTM